MEMINFLKEYIFFAIFKAIDIYLFRFSFDIIAILFLHKIVIPVLELFISWYTVVYIRRFNLKYAHYSLVKVQSHC